MASDFCNQRHINGPPICCHTYTPGEISAFALSMMCDALDVTKNTRTEHELLSTELVALDRLIYKFTGPHRMQKYFKGLKKVKKHILRYLEMDVAKELTAFSDALPSETSVRCARQFYLPSRQMLEYILVRLHGAVSLLSSACTLAISVFRQVDQHSRMGLFVSQMLIFSALLSRIWALCSTLVRCLSSCYDRLYPQLSVLKGSKVAWLPESVKLTECVAVAPPMAPPAGGRKTLVDENSTSHKTRPIVQPTANRIQSVKEEVMASSLKNNGRIHEPDKKISLWKGRVKASTNLAMLVETAQMFAAATSGDDNDKKIRDLLYKLRQLQRLNGGGDDEGVMERGRKTALKTIIRICRGGTKRVKEIVKMNKKKKNEIVEALQVKKSKKGKAKDEVVAILPETDLNKNREVVETITEKRLKKKKKKEGAAEILPVKKIKKKRKKNDELVKIIPERKLKKRKIDEVLLPERKLKKKKKRELKEKCINSLKIKRQTTDDDHDTDVENVIQKKLKLNNGHIDENRIKDN